MVAMIHLDEGPVYEGPALLVADGGLRVDNSSATGAIYRSHDLDLLHG